MIKTNFSLRSRIFISMIVLVLLASVLIAGITIYQYSEQAKDYHADRLERKEEQLKRSLWYTLQESPLVQNKANVSPIFSESLFAISDVQNVNFSLYDLDGAFIQTANPTAGPVEAAASLPADILKNLKQNKRWVVTQDLMLMSKLSCRQRCQIRKCIWIKFESVNFGSSSYVKAQPTVTCFTYELDPKLTLGLKK